MKIAKKASKSKAGQSAKPNRPKRSTTSRAIEAATEHIAKLNDVHPDLRAMVDGYLKQKNIPLKVHTMRFAEDVGDDHKCCLLNGQIVCGPQCF